VLPEVHQLWGDGDWSQHLDGILTWVRGREAQDPANTTPAQGARA
jgi:hypothetical protein